MSARSIGEIVAPLIAEAVGIANLQLMLEQVDKPSTRKWLVMSWYQRDFITASEAELLIEHNRLEAA